MIIHIINQEILSVSAWRDYQPNTESHGLQAATDSNIDIPTHIRLKNEKEVWESELKLGYTVVGNTKRYFATNNKDASFDIGEQVTAEVKLTENG